MSGVLELLADFDRVCVDLGLRWYLFGAQAALFHGSTRLTGDADVTVELGTRSARDVVRALLQAGFELRVSDVESFVERTRVLPLTHRGSTIPLDVVLAGPGIEELFFERARRHEISAGVSIPVAAAEDIVAMKILAGRAKDIEDVRAILRARSGEIDTGLIRKTLRMLEQALDQSDLLALFESLQKR